MEPTTPSTQSSPGGANQPSSHQKPTAPGLPPPPPPPPPTQIGMAQPVIEPARVLTFWDLPRELRDMIYKEAAVVDGGYIYNPESGKLKAATPQAHPFALQRTCKRAALEMTGLALSLNTLHFSTVATKREAAFRFEFMLHALDQMSRRDVAYGPWKAWIPEEDREEEASPALVALVRERVMGEFPEFLPAVDALLDLTWRPGGEPGDPIDFIRAINAEPSRARQFSRFLMYLFRQALPPSEFDECAPLPDSSLIPEEWDMPSEMQLDRMSQAFRPWAEKYERQYGTPVIELDRIWDQNRFRYRFSAAAAAIQFLRRHPSSRRYVRRIVLNEDRESVAHPESHGKGLIPFCTENPLLRIERRLDFVRNVLSAVSGTARFRPGMWHNRMTGHNTLGLRVNAAYELENAREVYQGWYNRWPDNVDINVGELIPGVAKWIREASVLPSNISLVLDGSIAPEHSSQVFRHYVVPSAVWQEALEMSYRRGLLPKFIDVAEPPSGSWEEGWYYTSLRADTKVFSPDWWYWRVEDHEARDEGYVFPGFPQMIRDIISGSGQVRCNFPVEPMLPEDVERLVTDHSSYSKEDWKEVNTRIRRDGAGRTVHAFWRDPITPILSALARENVLPDRSQGPEDAATL